LNAAYTQRAPTYVELFANGPHLATDSFEIGDAALGLEQSLGLDLSLRKQKGRITGSVSLFYNRFEDFIALTPTGADFIEEEGEEGLPIFAYRGTDAHFFGGEVETVFHLIQPATESIASSNKQVMEAGPRGSSSRQRMHSHALHFDVRADYVQTYDQQTGRSLPRITPFRALGALVYESQGFSARIEAQYSARQNRTAAFELPTDSYVLLNASVSYRFKTGPVDFDVFVRGTNLTNEEARQHTSFLKEIAPLPGRGVLVGLRAEF
jgi:iron complex outermembrane receptor protein